MLHVTSLGAIARGGGLDNDKTLLFDNVSRRLSQAMSCATVKREAV